MNSVVGPLKAPVMVTNQSVYDTWSSWLAFRRWLIRYSLWHLMWDTLVHLHRWFLLLCFLIVWLCYGPIGGVGEQIQQLKDRQVTGTLLKEHWFFLRSWITMRLFLFYFIVSYDSLHINFIWKWKNILTLCLKLKHMIFFLYTCKR